MQHCLDLKGCVQRNSTLKLGTSTLPGLHSEHLFTIAIAGEPVHFMGTRLLLNHQKKAVDTHDLRHSKVYSCTYTC